MPEASNVSTDLRLWGVSRVADNEQALMLSFDRSPTDDELRAIHERFRARRFDDPLIASLREAATHAEETYGSASIPKAIRDAIAALMETT
jgi:hypothetical protein